MAFYSATFLNTRIVVTSSIVPVDFNSVSDTFSIVTWISQICFPEFSIVDTYFMIFPSIVIGEIEIFSLLVKPNVSRTRSK